MFTGDIGLFRSALLLSGFFEESECSIFNDKRKASDTRRLKLFGGTFVANAPREQQLVLRENLEKIFGDRLLSTYIIDGYCHWRNHKSFCVVIKA